MRRSAQALCSAAGLLFLAEGAWALPAAPVHFSAPARTPVTMTLTGMVSVGGTPAGAGVEVAVRDPQGVLCGASGVDAGNGGAFILHIYGDDPTTAADEGARPGDALTFEVYHPAGPGSYPSVHFPPASFGTPPPVPGSPASFEDRAGYSAAVWVNRPPVLTPVGNRAVAEGATLVFGVDAADPDLSSGVGEILSYAASDVPPGALFDPGSHTFTWAPAAGQAGNYAVTFTVTDGGVPPLSDAETVTLSVGDVNRPPVLAPVGDQAIDEGQPLAFTLSAADPDDDALVYNAADLPPGAVLDSATGAFSWKPTFGGAGNYATTFSVTDTGTPPLTDSETITITVGNVNRPPALAPIGNQSVKEAGLLSFSVNATDPDADALTYGVVLPLPAGALFDPANHTFTWVPTLGQAGSYSVTFTVTDNGVPPLSANRSITITVGAGNRPPVLAPIGNRSVNEGTLLTFAVSATDPDGDSLLFAAPQLPPGAAFDPTTRVFAWVPDPGQAGTHSAAFSVADSGIPPLTDSETITITVGGGNRPPVLAPIGARTTTEETPLVFTITAADPDADPLTFTATSLPPGATFEPATQRFSWTPQVGDAGSYTVTFQVTDGGIPRLSDQETVALEVRELPARPAPEPPAGGGGGGGGGGCFLQSLQP